LIFRNTSTQLGEEIYRSKRAAVVLLPPPSPGWSTRWFERTSAGDAERPLIFRARLAGPWAEPDRHPSPGHPNHHTTSRWNFWPNLLRCPQAYLVRKAPTKAVLKALLISAGWT